MAKERDLGQVKLERPDRFVKTKIKPPWIESLEFYAWAYDPIGATKRWMGIDVKAENGVVVSSGGVTENRLVTDMIPGPNPRTPLIRALTSLAIPNLR